MPKKEDKVEEQLKKMTDFRSLVLTSLVTALSLVVGLFWKDVVTDAINKIVPTGDTLIYKFLAAVMATAAVVVAFYLLIRMHRIADKRLQEIQRFRKDLQRRRREEK